MVLPFYTPTSDMKDLVSHILATTLYGHYFFVLAVLLSV